MSGIALLNLVVVGLAGIAIYEDKLEHVGRSRTTSQNFSLLIERELSAVFDRIDLSLHLVVDEFERRNAAASFDEDEVKASLLHHQSHVAEITSMQITDANGLVRYGDPSASQHLADLNERDFLVLQRGNPNAGFVIGKPVSAGVRQEWVIPVSRRLNLPSGEFAGIVFASIPVAHFVDLFSTLSLGSHGLVALRSADHISMARFPPLQSDGGRVGQFALSKELRGLLAHNPSSVTYVAPAPLDQIERMFAYTKLAHYPLYVIVGLATQDTLIEWWRDTAQLAAVVLLFSAMTAVFGRLVARAWRRQVAAADALHESEQRWSFALEGGGFAVWDWNIETGEIQLPKFDTQLLGYAKGEIGNRMAHWEPVCHPDDRAHVLACMKDHFRRRTPNFDAELRLRCKDGSWKWMRTRGLVVRRDAQGRALRMIGTHLDITQRRGREDELRLSAAVFNLADEAMVITSARNEIVSVNPAFTAITGYSAQEALGRNPGMLSARTHSKEFYRDMWAKLTERGAWSGEVLNRKKNGETYVEWLSIKRVLDDKGQLTHHVAVFSDITERKATQDRTRHLALHDALTDLPNRTLLTERLEHAIVRARRDRASLALMYFDIDHFKTVNDSFGHEVGDLLLKAVARRTVDCVRGSDTVARIGGDEFVVLLPSLDKGKDAMVVAQKIRAALNQAFEIAGHRLQVSASIGLSVFPDHGADEQELTRNADAAMYQAKKNGRNQAVLFEPGLQETPTRSVSPPATRSELEPVTEDR